VDTRVVTYGTVVWAIDSFAPYKSPGMDGIIPGPVAKEMGGVLVPYLVKIFHACLATDYVPAIWHQVKVVFIPKPDRNSYSGPKGFRTNSLTSLFLRP
jgi:hypothetical protein